MRIAILCLSLLGSQNLYAMKQSEQRTVAPISITGILLFGIHHIIKTKSGPTKSVTFSNERHEFYFPESDHESDDDSESDDVSAIEPLSLENPIGARIAAERKISLIEMETARHFVECILGLQQLIIVEQSISSCSRSKALDQFVRVIFSGTNLATALNTVENILGGNIANYQYYDLLFDLSFNYPEPILSSAILDNMENQSDSDLLATLLVEDGSLLNILVGFYRRLAKYQPETGARLYELKGDLIVILNQGMKVPKGFYEKIQRIVNLVLK